MNGRMHLVCLLLGGVLASMLAMAVGAVEPDLKGVSDPTKPPPGVMLKMTGEGHAGHGAKSDERGVPGADALAAMSAASAASGASAPASTASGADAGHVDPWVVTSIRIDLATGQGVALVGDEVVMVGDKVHGMSVVAISASEVQLKGPDGIRKLVLADANEPSRAKPARAAKRGRKEKK